MQAYVAYSNTSSQPRPAVIVVPDYDGIGNYERWRADLLASLGYVGARAPCCPKGAANLDMPHKLTCWQAHGM